jgi:NarL family two-component system response regulator LiaR
LADDIRVLIADDHAVVRVGLRALLASEPGFEVIGEAADGLAAIEQVRALRPDVLLLDLRMPGKNGLQVIEELDDTTPAVRILVLTSFAEDEHLFPAIRAGALGYMLKESRPHELLTAIRDVAHGESSLHPAVARRLLQELAHPAAPSAAEHEAEHLTERETEVLELVAHGLSNKDIAVQLHLSERTVRSHVSTILGKLQLSSRTQAALYALRTGRAQLTEEQ